MAACLATVTAIGFHEIDVDIGRAWRAYGQGTAVTTVTFAVAAAAHIDRVDTDITDRGCVDGNVASVQVLFPA